MFLSVCSSCVVRTFLWNSQIMILHPLRLIKGSRLQMSVYTVQSARNLTRNCSTHVLSASNFDIASKKDIASKLGLEENVLVDSLQKCPDLLSVSPLQWESCFRELMNNGFSSEDSLSMVTKCPSLLQTNVKDLAVAFKHWRGVELGEKNILSLVKTCPKLLQMHGQQISLRISHLKTIGSDKDIVNLLKNVPRLMFENWHDVLAKLSFLVDEVRIERKKILKSYALNRSLLFLKTRFVFLERCGTYVKPKLDADPNTPSKNPPLKSIVETDDETFSIEVAGVTLEEFEVFQELYAMEVEESEMTDSDSE